ncbi:MAG TPA: 6-carboxytetrahydropterin synthase [Xanthomonadaceae bacterium]|nr:6-carboxytetrahydropterin synthase [Xanthomonadaceae bacterium]
MSTGMDDGVVIRLDKENMKFSAGHFTIFGPGERERLHGHNFKVAVVLHAGVGDNGLCFDYGIYKRKVVALCRELNEYFLLPGRSPLLRVREEGDAVVAVFGDEHIPFLRSDVLVLPITNVTLEELAGYLLARLLEDAQAIDAHGIDAIEVSVASGPGQDATRCWRRLRDGR